ncbi:MAG: hypothetical protein ACRD2Z_11925 [Thermoanaerobaculia bacterium]
MGILDSIGDAARQVGGVFKGAAEALWETGEGIVGLGVGIAKTSYDTSPLGLAITGATQLYERTTGNEAKLPEWLPSAERGAARLGAAAEVVGTIVQDPGLLVDAVVDPIRDDWNNGNYGEAIGRGAIEVLGVVFGTKGVDKLAKTARIADAAGDAGRAARAADTATDAARAGRAAETAEDTADAGRAARQADRATDAGHGLSRSQIDEIKATPKGQRPDPSEYLSPTYISDHLAQFDAGATRFMPRSTLNKYGIAREDGTSFVMPRHEADLIEDAARRGDLRYVEEALGLKEGFFDQGELVRVDVPNPRELNLRIPSGNEAGASELWIPGGKLPNGASEAVIDAGGLPDSRYTTRVVEVAGGNGE